MIHTQDADFTLICADVLDGLRSLEDGSVHCVVTSPPYWGLRDYGTGLWAGGDEDCDHTPPKREHGVYKNGQGQSYKSSNTNWDSPHKSYGQECGKCGATRQDQQLGLEATPDLYVARIIEVFREVRRVLRADGTCWVNLGDSYAASGSTVDTVAARDRDDRGKHKERYKAEGRSTGQHGGWEGRAEYGRGTAVGGLKPKDLVGIPWRVAFALQADGWYLRSDIIWAKPNPMPESVTDRPTKAHEYVFLLSKQARYFFDQEAVREPGSDDSHGGGTVGARYRELRGAYNGYSPAAAGANGRNVRSVWEIATQPYPEAHFATYPEELVRRCVLAGSSERGCCAVCGKPWERVTEREKEPTGKSPAIGEKSKAYLERDDRQRPFPYARTGEHFRWNVETIGWRPCCNCACGTETEREETTIGEFRGTSPIPSRSASAPIPCTVLDPFLGSGTTAYVARKHGRRSIGIELNPAYADLAARRMQQQSLLV